MTSVANWKFTVRSALLLAVLLFVPISRPAWPQELPPAPAVQPVTGKVELDRGRGLFSSGIGPAENVAIYLENPSIPPPPPLKGFFRMVQQSKRFDPPIIVVTPGTEVDFPNKDPIFHNVFSPYYGPAFDLGLYKPGDSKRVDLPAADYLADGAPQRGSSLSA